MTTERAAPPDSWCLEQHRFVFVLQQPSPVEVSRISLR